MRKNFNSKTRQLTGNICAVVSFQFFPCIQFEKNHLPTLISAGFFIGCGNERIRERLLRKAKGEVRKLVRKDPKCDKALCN